MAARVKLTIVEGPMKGKEFLFEEHDTFLFGRSSDCHASLPKDKCVSRFHFLLEANPPELRIRDLGSLNGTYVNEHRCGARDPDESPEEGRRYCFPQVDLRNDDRIQVGQTIIHVELQGSVFEAAQGGPEEKEHRESSTFHLVGKAGEASAAPSDGDLEEALATAPVSGEQVMIERPQASSQIPPDLEIAEYVIKKELDKGPMGTTYLAHADKGADKTAVKVMTPRVPVTDEMRAQFLEEIEELTRLEHPNIAAMLTHGVQDDNFYFVMPYAEKGSVRDLLRRNDGKTSLRRTAGIMLQALKGLEHAHKLGIVHRNLKPSNILLDTDEDGKWCVHVTEFGLARCFEKAGLSGMTAIGANSSNYPYMPREQLIRFKKAAPAGDVWSMGATFYEMLTGEPPLEFNEDRDPVDVILRCEMVPIRERDESIPEEVAQVIEHALQVNEDDRYPTAHEFREALKRALTK